MKVALAGYGFAGKTFHAPLIRSVEGLELKSVVTSRVKEVAADLEGVAALASAEEAMRDPEVELLVVATPNNSHFELARRALASGKHVVVDKPFTVTAAEAVELAEQAKAAGRLLAVFHNRRWDADFLTVRQVIAGGELGEVAHFESHYDRYRPVVQHRWRESGEAGSGIWFDLGAHLVDQALVLFGEPDAVWGDLEAQRAGAQAVDYFHVVMRYGKMRVVLHASSLVAETVRRFEVHGTRGSFAKHGMDTQEEALKRGERPGAEGWGEDPEPAVLTTWSEGARKVRKIRMLPGNYRIFYEKVRDAIAGKGDNPVPVKDGIAVMKVLESCTRVVL